MTKKDENNYIFGVFDGHGLEGHLVSQAITNFLNNNMTSSIFSSRENIFLIFKQLSSTINSSLTFNAMESGSTAVIIFISNNQIISTNCGDGRAILISENEQNIIPLSRDHKPGRKKKNNRMWRKGG